MSKSMLGLCVGLALGAVLAFGGFAELCVCVVGALIGLLVGKVLDGQLDLAQYVGNKAAR